MEMIFLDLMLCQEDTGLDQVVLDLEMYSLMFGQ